MKRILIFRESIRSKLALNLLDKYLFGEMFDSISVEDSEIIFQNIDNLKGVESFAKIFTEFINEHSSQQYDLIVIPVWIGNPLQYNGLNLAMHWRLSENNTSRYSNILIYGFLDELTVFKNCNFAGFLNSDSVSYKNILGLEINSMIKDVKLAYSNKYDLEKNLKYFNVLPPSNYKTNHSITNEWSILQWSKALKIEKDNASLLKVEESINSILFYKYLKAKLSLSGSAEMPEKTLQNKGKILFIDDEMEKGWELIFKAITSNFDKNNVHFLGSEFKGHSNPDEIVTEIMKNVKDTKIDPDVIVLDLRLHDNDYDKKTKINESTGYKALKKIKEHNRGIQVIILTASNKIWNMQALQNIEIKEKGIIVGADGFIVKESPENSKDPEFTKESLANIYNTIDACFRVKELKNINVKLQQLKVIISNNPVLSKETYWFNTTLQSIEYLIFDLLSSVKKSDKYLNYSYLQLFFIVEEYLRLESVFKEGEYSSVIDKDGKSFAVRNYSYKKNNKSIYESAIKFSSNYKLEKCETNRNIDANYKMSCLLLLLFGLTTSGQKLENSEVNWTAIYLLRNNLGHGNEIKVEWDDINNILEFMIFIFDINNQNNNGTMYALEEVNTEDKLRVNSNFIVKKNKK